MFKFCSEAVVALLFWQTKQNLSYSLNCSIRLWISRFGYVLWCCYSLNCSLRWANFLYMLLFTRVQKLMNVSICTELNNGKPCSNFGGRCATGTAFLSPSALHSLSSRAIFISSSSPCPLVQLQFLTARKHLHS